MLPEQFLRRMENLLGSEYQDFLASYEKPKVSSLRFNSLKGTEEDFIEKAGFSLHPIPWAAGGYYYKEDERPGKHPYHEAGVYYIQEASAMAPAEYLSPVPGERVLDLCAAPGGKSAQLGAAMKGEGLLVCNEIHPQRARILSGNIERMGIANALVLNHEPSHLAERFPAFFDKVLVDAPCSGEGMFRKKEEAALEWGLSNIQMCARRQEDILESAAVMLKPGGRMVYSTCTFALEENEGTVGSFLKKHPEFSLEKAGRFQGMAPGIGCGENAKAMVRLWPHKIAGEGHFLACLKKEGAANGKGKAHREEKGVSSKELKEWEDFRKQYLRDGFQGRYLKFGEQLYLIPEGIPALEGLKALRPGLHLGTIKKKRFEPSHALALSLRPEGAALSFQTDRRGAEAYLSGQTLQAEGEKGWYLITIDGYSLGWGKLSGGIMKNHYPSGLRK